jgi:hypothetical protein
VLVSAYARRADSGAGGERPRGLRIDAFWGVYLDRGAEVVRSPTTSAATRKMMVSNLIIDLLGLAGGIALLTTRQWPVGILVIVYAGGCLVHLWPED